jgi:hypothetical protein
LFITISGILLDQTVLSLRQATKVTEVRLVELERAGRWTPVMIISGEQPDADTTAGWLGAESGAHSCDRSRFHSRSPPPHKATPLLKLFKVVQQVALGQ